MRLRHISRIATMALMVAALTTGCSIFGGDDAEELGGGSGANGSGGEFGGADGGLDGGGGMGGVGVEVAELERVYFDYDRSTLRDDQRPTLRANAAAVQNHADWRTVVIEGHCDERGSEEYNLALGERRANSVRKYLSDSGVPDARLDVVSFGESRPAVQGHDESAFRFNRRAEFRVIY
jgi:peptidoglycan-associated lipoprotein